MAGSGTAFTFALKMPVGKISKQNQSATNQTIVNFNQENILIAEEQRMFIEKGMDDTMSKPISIKELQKKIQQWVMIADKKSA